VASAGELSIKGDVRTGKRPTGSHDRDGGKFITWAIRHNTFLTLAAACVPPLLYLIFIDRYATNSFFGDDWELAALTHSARHGRLTLGILWGQYNESRLFFGNLIDVAFGLADRLDLRSVIFGAAGVLIGSYAILLALCRRYFGGRLTPIPVLAIGVVWFSLADVQNALWAFQLSWFLTVFFYLGAVFALLTAKNHGAWLAVGVCAAIGASLATDVGFLVWLLGAICILWTRTEARRRVRDIAIWAGVMLATIAVYLPGYHFNENGCTPSRVCTPDVALHHPVTTLRYFLILMGNVIPGGRTIIYLDPVRNLARFEIVGMALFASAMFVLVQSWRHRYSETMPLPLLLIGFALAFDVTVALDRSGLGLSSAVNSNRYVIANLILLSGIVIYAWAHRPPMRWLPIGAVGIFLVVQATVATGFGIENGIAMSGVLTTDARLFVNSDRVSRHVRYCEFYVAMIYQPGTLEHPAFALWVQDAASDRLGEYSDRTYFDLGLPTLFKGCAGKHR
jgi:hypothetical protein